MTIEKANKVYDLLVSIGGAQEDDRDNFIYHHTESKYGSTEWRFCGKLGFGGKYRSGSNRVDCYREDESPERIKLIEVLNIALGNIQNSDIINSICTVCGKKFGDVKKCCNIKCTNPFQTKI